MSDTELRLQQAYEALGENVFTTFVGQCEVAKHLREQYKLTRDQIAQLMRLTPRQVKTRLGSGLLNCITKGLLPSREFTQAFGDVQIADDVVQDEIAKRDNSKLQSEAKRLFNSSLFSDKLAEAVSRQLPTAQQIEKVNELWQSEKQLHESIYQGRYTPKDTRPELVAMATMSDAHFYQVSNSFNSTKAAEANQNYFDQVFERAYEKRESYKINTIHLNLLGDNMQGTANYDNQRWDTDRCAIDQAEALTWVYANNIARSLMHFENVVVNGMPGNHGKITSKSSEPDHSNWETVVLRSLQWAYRFDERVKFNLSDNWYQVIEANSQKFLLTHGHALNGAGNYENIVGTIRKWQDTLEYFDYAIMGHFHRSAKLPLTRNKTNPKHRSVFINGCYPTEDSFIEKFGASHTNLQWLFFIANDGIADAIEIEIYKNVEKV